MSLAHPKHPAAYAATPRRRKLEAARRANNRLSEKNTRRFVVAP